MIKGVLSSSFDLPFYLRLPSAVFLTWDPDGIGAAVRPRQRLGQASFARNTTLAREEQLLDSRCAPFRTAAPGHNVVMVCETTDGRKIPTLAVDTTDDGGCSELRPYTELTILVALLEIPTDPQLTIHRSRVMGVLNHFLTLYRLLTQDPWVTQIGHQLDLYLIDDAVGRVPDAMAQQSSEQLFAHLEEVDFAQDIGRGRQYTYRLNTLEDLFPGPVLPHEHLQEFARAVRVDYAVPLHYELILQAQTQLKLRNYHVAVVEAQTALEVYIADLLVRLHEATGGDRAAILAALEDPRGLGHLMRRITALDDAATTYSRTHDNPAWRLFKGSAQYREWHDGLYDLRNRIAHGGYRGVSFAEAKRGIAAGKAAIAHLEAKLPAFANRVQIDPRCDHLQDTAGRLRL